MRLLLDTHIFLWFVSGDTKLSKTAHEAIVDAENVVLLSVASLWETIIKYDLGKLPLPESPTTYIPRQRESHLIESLPINESSLGKLAGLPRIHSDPFDRFLVSQALAADLTVVTSDGDIPKYDVKTLI